MCCCLIKLQIIQPLIKKVNKQNKSFCEAHYFIWILRQCSLFSSFSRHLVGQSEHHTSSAVEVWCWEHPQEESRKQETWRLKSKLFERKCPFSCLFPLQKLVFLFFLEEGKVIKEYQKNKSNGLSHDFNFQLVEPESRSIVFQQPCFQCCCGTWY